MDTAAKKQVPYAEFLADLLRFEVAARRERYLRTRTRLAHLPFQRTPEQFEVRFQPTRGKSKTLRRSRFASDAANVILLGPPGVGKTHLSVALALKAIDAGCGVYFVRAHELLEDLCRAQEEHPLDRRMRV